MSKEDFKNFIKTKPELSNYVNNGEMTWQKFYELYDLYGEDEKVWSQYQSKKETRKITDIIGNIDVDSLQKHIENAQKALSFFTELSTKDSVSDSLSETPNIDRPITKFFGD